MSSDDLHAAAKDRLLLDNERSTVAKPDATNKGPTADPGEIDDFGLPVKKNRRRPRAETATEEEREGLRQGFHDAPERDNAVEPGNICSQDAADARSRTHADDEALTHPEARSTSTGASASDIADIADCTEALSLNTAASGAEERPTTPCSESPLNARKHSYAVSEWSHQQLVSPKSDATGDEEKKNDDLAWQEMPAYASHDLYDDDGKLIAQARDNMDDDAYEGLGGAGKGYTRVQLDEDAKSVTSLDENTQYLFKQVGTNVADENEEARDPLTQMQATKTLLTEGQRIAYVGVTRLILHQMSKELESMEGGKATKRELRLAVEAFKMWSQKMLLRVYSHMEISSAEQVMIEQLAGHGVQPSDMTPSLMQNARVRNPIAESISDSRSSISSPFPDYVHERNRSSQSISTTDTPPPPPYVDHDGCDLGEVRTPSELPDTKKLDIDLRWTVLCDLFLVLVSDSIYDARSRSLLERVGDSMNVSQIDICRFEKRVTDALEMQEVRNKETWEEEGHMENRRKKGLKRKYMMMGLATVGGGLVIGLSAGLLAPVIGAGLAAGFTTIGVAGTSTFLGGAGGAALITSGATIAGGTIAVRASNRRTGSVKTFEYKPLYNNKRLNLVVTVSGWMIGKADDVRLPFSTVDPIMGDIYSLLWEPEMLQSMGATINILATEALTQTVQQVLGATILTALMASLQLPIVLSKLAYLIDNPWNVSLDRATSAGLILADSLIDRNLGARPITLIGFSLGARVVFSCLKELASRGAFGIVQNVYMFGSPVVANRDDWLRARSIITGRFVNGYASNDWILGYLFRATSGGIMRVAGLAPVEGIPQLENVDCTEFVNGHMAYRAAMPKLLRHVGWEVTSDEFAEIEDPDPDNHEERQRELIHEIEAARKEAKEMPEKKRFTFFKRGSYTEKKRWETYDENSRERRPNSSIHSSNESNSSFQNGGFFDINAIRAELASEQIEVKQLESTMPPMQLDLNKQVNDKRPWPKKDVDVDSRKRAMTSPPRPPSKLRHAYDADLARNEYPGWHTRDFELEHGRADSIQMTFESSFNEPLRSSGVGSYSITQNVPGNLTEVPAMPVDLSALTMERNAWADEVDDEDDGKEGEIQMTFE